MNSLANENRIIVLEEYTPHLLNLFAHSLSLFLFLFFYFHFYLSRGHKHTFFFLLFYFFFFPLLKQLKHFRSYGKRSLGLTWCHLLLKTNIYTHTEQTDSFKVFQKSWWIFFSLCVHFRRCHQLTISKINHVIVAFRVSSVARDMGEEQRERERKKKTTGFLLCCVN